MKSSLAFLKRVISVMNSTLGSLRCNLYPGNNRDVRVVVELEVLSRRVNGFCGEREREREVTEVILLQKSWDHGREILF